MQRFVIEPTLTRIVFGAGTFESVGKEAGSIGTKLLVVSTPGQILLARRIADRLGASVAGIHAQAAMHVPISVAAAGITAARDAAVDGLVAIGGGSAIGLAKAIALESGLPILAIPTTYSGSEMTSVWGLTRDGEKRTGRDERVRPVTVIYDPELTTGLSARTSAASGVNAMAHCVEGLYSETANPLTSLMAEEAIRALSAALPAIADDPSDILARSEALYGAWLSGTVLGTVGMALHHKLCHTLGGSFGLPHAETHAIVLPHALAYNREAAPDAAARVARALGAQDGPRGLFDLLGRIALPCALKDIGMPRSGLKRVVELTLANPYYNPAPLDEARLAQLLDDAWAGRAPST